MTLPLFVSAVLPIACVRQLPPKPTPAAVAPAIDAAASASGQGRLVVDVVDGPTRVHRVRLTPEPIDDGSGRVTYRLVESPEVLCEASPCAAAVPLGNLLLGFPVVGDPDAMEVELVHVDAAPSVYRRALSVYDGDTGAVRVLGILGASIGGASMMTGTALLPIGIAEDIDGMTIAGGISLGVGAALVTLGILALQSDAETYQPGASHHFPVGGADQGRQ